MGSDRFVTCEVVSRNEHCIAGSRVHKGWYFPFLESLEALTNKRHRQVINWGVDQNP